MEAICIHQDDSKDKVLHRVTTTVDDKKYQITFSAECPMTAIKIAYEVPLTYWEEIGND
jgi:hypothetical protein